jgi:hypothetical protein
MYCEEVSVDIFLSGSGKRQNSLIAVLILEENIRVNLTEIDSNYQDMD